MKIDPSPDFVDESFMSGKEKEVVLNAWTRFLKNGCKLSICFRKDLGTVQYGRASNEPPYLMAVTPLTYDAQEEITFFIGNEATPVCSKFALPLKAIKDIIAVFAETGARDPAFSWEEV